MFLWFYFGFIHPSGMVHFSILFLEIGRPKKEGLAFTSPLGNWLKCRDQMGIGFSDPRERIAQRLEGSVFQCLGNGTFAVAIHKRHDRNQFTRTRAAVDAVDKNRNRVIFHTHENSRHEVECQVSLTFHAPWFRWCFLILLVRSIHIGIGKCPAAHGRQTFLADGGTCVPRKRLSAFHTAHAAP